MIKFIASDLDGTLLKDGTQSLTHRAIDLISKLQKKGIIFAAASGRQYPNLSRLFSPVADDMVFIAENGAIMMYKDMPIYSGAFPKEKTIELANYILDKKDFELLLSGPTSSYLMPKTSEYVDLVLRKIGNTVTIVKDLHIIHEDFVKISAYIPTFNAHDWIDEISADWSDEFGVFVSGDEWIDFARGTKADGLEIAMEKFGLKREEMVAFGDNFNDIAMLDFVGHSFVMDTAKDEVKSHGDYICETVEDVLEQILNDEFKFK